VRRKRAGLAFALPGLSVLVAVVAFPLGYALFLSFTRYSFIRPNYDFVGLNRYLEAIEEFYFRKSVLTSVFYVLTTVSLSLCFGFILALLLYQKLPLKGFHYFAMSLPMLIAPVGVGLIWKMILHPELGILSYLFGRRDFLGDPRYALFTLAFVDVWQQMSFVALVFLAGLRSLPKEPFEAAVVDGANFWQILRYITIPLLTPIIAVLLIYQTVVEIKTYDLVYVLTKGGPGVSTDLISYYIYRKAFLGLDLSGGSAMAYILLCFSLILIFLYYRILLKS